VRSRRPVVFPDRVVEYHMEQQVRNTRKAEERYLQRIKDKG